MDALGYGESDKPHDSAQYTPEYRAADVISVLNELKIDKAHFFGNSLGGGGVGFVLADLYPERFLSFMLGSAHPYGSSQPIGCNLFPEIFLEQLRHDGIKKFVENIEEQFIHRKLHEGVRKNYLLNDPAAIIAANTPNWPDRSACLKKINVPVLLFAGELDPVSEFLPSLAQEIPRCTVEILARADHCDAYWDSNKTVPLAKKFMQKYFPEYSPEPGM